MATIPKWTDRCPDAQHIKGYADCTLDDEETVLIEEHLSGCNRCSDILAKAVEGGAVPFWLSRLAADSTCIESYAEPIPSDANSVDSMATTERYQRIRLQGEGGMGQVWEGWDVVMKRRVALKQLRSGSRNAERDRRLLQEATSLARLSHPNIVAVHEVLMLNEQPAIVMEFIDGPTLSGISRDFVMSERQAAKIMERLADAMVHAHEQGVIHRDLKPGNVLLSWSNEALSSAQKIDVQKFESAIPKLTDFGMAKILEGDDLTRTGDLLGTPAYMAPEQTIGLTNVSEHRTDIYGLGAILYDLLTGTPPHVAENPVTTMMLVREREPTAPRLLRPELSRDIETICLKCLQKLPKDRYVNASDLRSDLRAYLDGRPISARPLGFIHSTVRWSRRHTSIVASAILAASLVLTVVLGSLWTASKERRLRLDANDAKTEAERSEKKFIAEAERANHALEVNREHFEVALDHVNRLAHMAYNPLNKTQTELDYNREIRQATKDIYATYLDTLPPPEEWTLKEAYAVTFYIKYMMALFGSDSAVDWLERVKCEVPRLERESPDSPKKREFLAQHYLSLHIHAYAVNDLIAAGKYGEVAGKFVDVDARQAAFVLMNTALTYKKTGKYDDAIRAANSSLAAYRTAMDQPNPMPDDPFNLLDYLRWHRIIANEAGNKEEADKNVEEFDKRSRQFDQSSPFYARVQTVIQSFYNQQ